MIQSLSYSYSSICNDTISLYSIVNHRFNLFEHFKYTRQFLANKISVKNRFYGTRPTILAGAPSRTSDFVGTRTFKFANARYATRIQARGMSSVQMV